MENIVERPNAEQGRRDDLPLWIPVLAVCSLGASFAAWPRAFVGSFGRTVASEVIIATLLAGGVALGLARGLPRFVRAGDSLRSLGLRLAAIGALTFGGDTLATLAGRALVWAGASVDAGVLGASFARALMGGLVLLPVAVTAGSILGTISRHISMGPARAGLGARLAACAGLGVLATQVALLAREEPYVPFLVGGAVSTAAGLLIAFTSRPRRARRTPDTLPAQDLLSVPALAAGATGFTVAALAFLTERAHVAAFANDLWNVPVVEVLFAASFVAGAAASAFFASRVLREPLAWTGPGLLMATVLLLFVGLARFDEIPKAFHAGIASEKLLSRVIQRAFLAAAPSVIPLGFSLGTAAGLCAGSAFLSKGVRSCLAAAFGAVLGTAFPRAFLSPGSIEAAHLAAGGAAALLAVTASFRSGLRPLPRTAATLALLAILAFGIVRPPRTDRELLLVDRDLSSATSLRPIVQQHWKAFDEDELSQTVAVLRRGHSNRLLVNGRFEMSNEGDLKTHGLLAHLPLLVHPDPKTVLVLGAANGLAIEAALAHPIERLECFIENRASLKAAARFGHLVQNALLDPRLKVRVGDAGDFLSRSRTRYDVILNQISGAWTERSARLSTRESVELAKMRLAEAGIYCFWVPGSSLTKEGFQTLLATVASVFPQVEIWSGERDDTLLLAKTAPGPHDFERILAGYQDGRIAAGARRARVDEPLTLLSHYLAGDAAVRTLSRGKRIHSRMEPELSRRELRRRFGTFTVDPVSGLAEIRDDVLRALVNAPEEGFAEGLRRAIRARDLERAGLEREVQGDDFGAVDLYQSALELNPRDGSIRRVFATLRTQLGVQYADKHQFMAAHSNMREAVETDTTFAQGFANLGHLLLMIENFDYALSVTHQAAELEPDDDLFALQLGKIWKRRGYFDKALPYYERARALNPQNIEAAIGYIDTKLAMEDDKADLRMGLEFLRSHLAIAPNHPDLLYRIGKLEDAIRRGLRRPEGFDLPIRSPASEENTHDESEHHHDGEQLEGEPEAEARTDPTTN
jgi:spermidine synthase